jgi:LemA protein
MSSADLTDPAKVAAFDAAQERVRTTLMQVRQLQETYPQIAASAGFLNLQAQIEGTENRILRAREEYNKAVGAFNKELRHVSGKVLNPATGMEFKPRVYFDATPNAAVAPVVNFN